jgi:hypothetical protein
MLTGLFKSRQSVNVGGPIGSMKDATSKSLASPDYKAAYLLKRLTDYEEDPNPGLDMSIDRYRPQDSRPDMDQAEKTAYLMNAVKGYEAEAEESLKLEFKDWLRGEHNDNNDPQPYDNEKGGLKRRDTRGERLDEWYPTWWGKKQLTHLPGVREYLREEHISADKASFDMNMLAHFGPQNLEEAWAYFKYWVKRRPVGPWMRLNEPDAFANADTPFERSGPISMAPADANLNLETNARGRITKVHMPELARREAGNTSLVDKALAKALNSTAKREREEKMLEDQEKNLDRFGDIAISAARRTRALRRADPFQTRYAAELAEEDREELRSEYERALKDPAKSRSDLLWRRFMMDNGRQMTREEYNAAQLYTDKNTEVKLEARLKEIESLEGISEKETKWLQEEVKKRFEHEGSYADHYHFDQLLLKRLDNTESELRELIATKDVVDKIAADVADEITKEIVQEAQDEMDATERDRIDAIVNQRVDAIVKQRLDAILQERGIAENPEEPRRFVSPEPPGGRVGIHTRFEDGEPVDNSTASESDSQETLQPTSFPPGSLFRNSPRARNLDFLAEVERVEGSRRQSLPPVPETRRRSM